MPKKKRIPAFDFYDLACTIAEMIDFVRFIFYNLGKNKFHLFHIVKTFKKEVRYRSIHVRFNCLHAKTGGQALNNLKKI